MISCNWVWLQSKKSMGERGAIPNESFKSQYVWLALYCLSFMKTSNVPDNTYSASKKLSGLYITAICHCGWDRRINHICKWRFDLVLNDIISQAQNGCSLNFKMGGLLFPNDPELFHFSKALNKNYAWKDSGPENAWSLPGPCFGTLVLFMSGTSRRSSSLEDISYSVCGVEWMGSR